MKIVLANQKGGVGKTTLAVLLANYLALKNNEVICLDFDLQGSLYYKFAQDSECHNNPPLFKAARVALSESSKYMRELEGIDKGMALIDLPGSLDNDNLPVIYQSADLIVCPFIYDKLSFESTFVFAKLMKLLKVNAQIVFIPNRLKTTVKYKNQEAVNKELSEFGTVIPAISDKIAFQRINVFEISEEVLQAIEPTFKTLYYDFIVK